jgi:predicted ATPase
MVIFVSVTKDGLAARRERFVAMTDSEPLRIALTLPDGARFYKCALQVNPYAYGVRHGKAKPAMTEAEYNGAIVEALRKAKIEVIAVADHHAIKSAASLAIAAREAGIVVFPGFEAGTKDGIHVVCLFDPDRPFEEVDRILGRIGIVDEKKHVPMCNFDLRELLDCGREHGFLCIAAHAEETAGLLVHREGAARVADWKQPDLLASSIGGTVAELPPELRAIVCNQDPQYKRITPMAIVNARDVTTPDDVAKPSASCWVKMSTVSLEGLRQAFLESETRIRLNSQPMPDEHAEIVAIAWTGGQLLDGAAIHWNPNLNVLIGGRGTGKSTVVESIRYAFGLDTLGDEARKNHEGIIKNVLGSGTKVSVLVRTYRPDLRCHRVERTVPNPPIVRDEHTGQVLTQSPTDILPGIEVYGQHEISELTKSPEKRTRLLWRFMKRDPELGRRKTDVKKQLERSRKQMSDAKKELSQLDEKLASMPRLEEMLRRFQESGLEEKLKERSLLVKEEQVFKSALARLQPLTDHVEAMKRALPIDVAFVSQKALEGLPGKEMLAPLHDALSKTTAALSKGAATLEEILAEGRNAIAAARTQWDDRRRAVQAEYEKLLRELQRSKVDGEELIRVRQQIEELRPLTDRRPILERELKELDAARRNLVAEWEDIVTKQFQELQRASRAVSGELRSRVRITVAAGGDRAPLVDLLNRHLSGRRADTIEALRSAPNLSLRGLVDACRQGKATLAQRFTIPPAQAEKLCELGEDVFMEIEEIELAPTTEIELNVGREGNEVWKRLDDLSTGQKATAVLLLLLLKSTAPLVVDQPEDDLDNRFITEGVVPRMKDEKRKRQFIFATHNANIPVLGDAELIVGLRPISEGGSGQDAVPVGQMGSIDREDVQKMVEEVLEGGKEAFETRRLKYGFVR